MAVSEVLALRWENATLKLQAVQTQMQQMQQTGQALIKDRDAVLVEMRAEVGAGPMDQYDPPSRTFKRANPVPQEMPIRKAGRKS